MSSCLTPEALKARPRPPRFSPWFQPSGSNFKSIVPEFLSILFLVNKRLLSALLLLQGTLPLFAATAPSDAAKLRRNTIDLFISGKSAAAVAQLQSKIPPTSGSDGAVIALVQGLVDI